MLPTASMLTVQPASSHQLHENVPGLAVEVGQGQATDAALDRGAELGQFHERLPQAVAVDVLMGGLQNVYGSVHDDLLRLFLWFLQAVLCRV